MITKMFIFIICYMIFSCKACNTCFECQLNNYPMVGIFENAGKLKSDFPPCLIPVVTGFKVKDVNCYQYPCTTAFKMEYDVTQDVKSMDKLVSYISLYRGCKRSTKKNILRYYNYNNGTLVTRFVEYCSIIYCNKNDVFTRYLFNYRPLFLFMCFEYSCSFETSSKMRNKYNEDKCLKAKKFKNTPCDNVCFVSINYLPSSVSIERGCLRRSFADDFYIPSYSIKKIKNQGYFEFRTCKNFSIAGKYYECNSWNIKLNESLLNLNNENDTDNEKVCLFCRSSQDIETASPCNSGYNGFTTSQFSFESCHTSCITYVQRHGTKVTTFRGCKRYYQRHPHIPWQLHGYKRFASGCADKQHLNFGKMIENTHFSYKSKQNQSFVDPNMKYSFIECQMICNALNFTLCWGIKYSEGSCEIIANDHNTDYITAPQNGVKYYLRSKSHASKCKSYVYSSCDAGSIPCNSEPIGDVGIDNIKYIEFVHHANDIRIAHQKEFPNEMNRIFLQGIKHSNIKRFNLEVKQMKLQRYGNNDTKINSTTKINIDSHTTIVNELNFTRNDQSLLHLDDDEHESDDYDIIMMICYVMVVITVIVIIMAGIRSIFVKKKSNSANLDNYSTCSYIRRESMLGSEISSIMGSRILCNADIRQVKEDKPSKSLNEQASHAKIKKKSNPNKNQGLEKTKKAIKEVIAINKRDSLPSLILNSSMYCSSEIIQESLVKGKANGGNSLTNSNAESQPKRDSTVNSEIK